MSDYHENLSTYAELISDDFQSTFMVINDNALQNMMGFKDDFDNLTRIIKNYIPSAEIKFTKLNWFPEDYDCYLIERIK